MHLLWQVALKADEQGIPRERLRYAPAEICSPYIEASFTDLNQNEIEEFCIEANPLYRFADIFAAIFDVNAKVPDKLRLELFDLCMQYMIQVDLRQGLSKGEYYLRFFLRDLMAGVCGENAAEAIVCFTPAEQRQLLTLMRVLFCCSDSLSLFRQALRAAYPNAFAYADRYRFRELYLYIGKKETRQESLRVNFILDMFLARDYTVHVFWEYHFGILGVDETMVLNEIALF